MWVVLTAAALLQAPASRTIGPRAIVREATRAVEADSVIALASRWTSLLDRDSSTNDALLGLATIARLSYRYPEATRLYLRITSERRLRQAVVPWAYLGLAKAVQTMGDNAGADSLYRLAWQQASGDGDSAASALALLGRSSTQLRIVGPMGALPLTPIWSCSRAAARPAASWFAGRVWRA